MLKSQTKKSKSKQTDQQKNGNSLSGSLKNSERKKRRLANLNCATLTVTDFWDWKSSPFFSSAAFRATVKEHGRLDILVNNAAIMDEQDWEKTLNVNLVKHISFFCEKTFFGCDHE